MASSLLEYECPACGGTVEFDVASQKLKCPYCDTTYTVEEFNKIIEERRKKAEESKADESGENKEWVDDNLLVYVCQSCGGEIVGDKNLGSTSCPFCGNNVIMTKQFTGGLKPNFVIPFKQDKEHAKEAIKGHMSNKKLIDDSFKSDSTLDEVKGIYVPFWLFSADCKADGTYKTTKLRTWSDSKYHYTETSTFEVKTAGKSRFDKIPADASKKIFDDLMDSVEPFDYSKMVPFDSGYLAGFYADRYDVEPNDLMNRIEPRIQNTIEKELRSTIKGYASVTQNAFSAKLQNLEKHYALLPVWILTVRWNDKPYTFAMNGQTGKFVGDLPLSKKKYNKYFFLYSLLIGTILAIARIILFLFVQ